MANPLLNSNSSGTTSSSPTKTQQFPEIHKLRGIPRVLIPHEGIIDFVLARRAFKSVPEQVHTALEYWACQGLPPAAWLQAILSSDMYFAIEYVPPAVMWQIPAIASMIKLYYPHDCYGSVEKVMKWCDTASLHMLETKELVKAVNEFERDEYIKTNEVDRCRG